MNYIQIVKTTDAELRGFRELESGIKKEILPLFELTRSRTSSKVPKGDINRRLENIRESTSGNPLVLDLTSHEDLANPQIEELLDERDGFKNWVDFVSTLDIPNIIPVIHVYPDEGFEGTKLQTKRLCEKFDQVALRFPCEDEQAPNYIAAVYNALPNNKELICIADMEYIDSENFSLWRQIGKNLCAQFQVAFPNAKLCLAGSSFPSSVVSVPGCNDDSGEIPILEWDLYREFRRTKPDLIYGDYGSVHPKRYQTRGGNWVPRVDYPLSEIIPYKRYRRKDGGYIKAANETTKASYFDDLNCWGAKQVHLANNGEPEGKSPSFWIAVRINIHSTRKVIDLRELNQ